MYSPSIFNTSPSFHTYAPRASFVSAPYESQYESQLSPRLMNSPNDYPSSYSVSNTRDSRIKIPPLKIPLGARSIPVEEYIVRPSREPIVLPEELRISDISGIHWNVGIRQQRSHEDRYQAKNIGSFKYFAIFDGHGGSRKMGEWHVSDYCAQYLHIAIAKEFIGIELDNRNQVREAIIRAFLNFDTEMYDIGMRYGSVCTAVLIDYESLVVYQINLGDSRSILFNSRTIFSITQDHNPNQPEEFERINAAHGVVMNSRIDGSLAVSRAFGDFDYKIVHGTYTPVQGKVSAVPVVTIIPMLDPMFCLLTSDAPYEKGTFTDSSLVQLFLSLKFESAASLMTSIIAPQVTDDVTIICIAL